MENFCLYKDRMEYSFENDKIIIITGPNGIGKTTIFQAIPYTFWGETATGLKGDDVVNNEVKKNCYTSVEFKITDGSVTDHYLCERHCKHSKLGDTVLLTKNGSLIKKGHREVVAEIDIILFPKKLFFNTLLFGQKIKTFFTDLGDADQKEIFRKVLILDNYLLFYDEASKMLKKEKETLNELKIKLQVNLGLLENIKKQVLDLEESKKQFYIKKKEDTSNIIKKIEEIEGILVVQRKNLKDLESIDSKLSVDIGLKINNLKNEKNSAINKRDDYLKDVKTKKEDKDNFVKSESSIKRLEIDSRKKSELNESLQEFISKENCLNIDLSKLRTNIDFLRKNYSDKVKEYKDRDDVIKKLKTSLDKEIVICSSCKQVVGKDNIRYLEKEVEEKEKDQSKLMVEIESLKKEGNSTKEKIETIENELKTISINKKNKEIEISSKYIVEFDENKINLDSILKSITDRFNQIVIEINADFENKTVELDVELSKLEKEKTNIDFKIQSKEKIQNLIRSYEANIETQKSLLKNKEGEEFRDEILVKNKEEAIKLINSLKSLEKLKDTVEENIEIYDFWKSGFSMSGIPSMLIDEAIPFMNERISEYLERIGGRYSVSFDTMDRKKDGEFKDKIAINVFDNVTKADKRKQLSGGQTRVVDIATILTLRDLQNLTQDMKCNIIILDEIFDSLDAKNIEYVSGVLRLLTKGNSINIISHTQIDQLDADEVLRFM